MQEVPRGKSDGGRIYGARTRVRMQMRARKKEDAGEEEGGAGCLVVGVVVEGGVHFGPPDVGAATYIIMLFYDVWSDVP